MISNRLRNAALALALLSAARAAADEVSVLQIRVVEGEGSVHRCGSRSATGLVVEVTDEAGKPVEGATVSYRMPEEGSGGVFADGLSTTVVPTGTSGRAEVRGIRWNSKPGPVNIRVTAAKGGARAGAAIFVYLSDTAVAPSKAHRGLKWLAIGILAIGAAGGAAYALSGRLKNSQAAAPPPTPLSIGAPTITVGRQP